MGILGAIAGKLLYHPRMARLLLKPVLRLHSRAYNLAGDLAVASDPERVHPKHGILRYQEWFVDHIRPGWTVADIGSHEGHMALAMSAKAAFVYGIEIEAGRVERARRNRARANIEYLCADATRVDLGARKVDCVTLSNVLEHIDDRVEFLRRLLANPIWKDPAHKALLIRVPLIERDWTAPFKKQLGLDYRLDPTHFTEYTVAQFREEMDGAGVEILSEEIRFGELYAVCRARG